MCHFECPVASLGYGARGHEVETPEVEIPKA